MTAVRSGHRRAKFEVKDNVFGPPRPTLSTSISTVSAKTRVTRLQRGVVTAP